MFLTLCALSHDDLLYFLKVLLRFRSSHVGHALTSGLGSGQSSPRATKVKLKLLTRKVSLLSLDVWEKFCLVTW